MLRFLQRADDGAKNELHSCYRTSVGRMGGDIARRRHESALTMIPRQFGPPKRQGEDDGRVTAFRATATHFEVPRFYGLAHFGAPDEDRLSDGEPLCASFVGELSEDQRRAFDRAAASLRSIGGCALVRRPGGGKTVLGIALACALGRRTLVLVHKSFLVDQWVERVRAFAPDATIGRIQQHRVDADADIVIGMIQSFFRRDYGREVLDSFGLVIVDETHHIAARVFFSVLFEKLAPRFVMGLSATLDRPDGLRPLIHMAVGPAIDTNPQDTGGGDGGDLVVVERVFHQSAAHMRGDLCVRGHVHMPSMCARLVADAGRNALAVDRTLQLYAEGHHVMVLSALRDHLSAMCEQLVGRAGVAAEHVGFFVGGMRARDRADAARRRVIFATYAMAKEGLDIATLSALVLATPAGNVEQAVGRIRRPCAEKKKPVRLVDIVDEFSVFAHMARKRLRFYESQKFEVD